MRSITAVRPTQAVAVAAVTLLAGLAGTVSQADAAINGATLKKNSVPANRIKNNALTGAQINEAKLGMVPLAKFAQLADFAKTADAAKTADNAKTADSARTAETARSADTARTADVAKDAQKLNGRDQTAFQANALRTVLAQTAPVATGAGATVTVSCNADEKATGGGAAWIIPGGDTPTELNAPLTASMPTPATGGTNLMTGWKAAGYNNAGAARVLRVYVTCVPRSA